MRSKWLRQILGIAIAAQITGCTPRHEIRAQKIPIQPKPISDSTAMSPVSYLRKLSLHLRGQTPEKTEYIELTKALEKDQAAEFFKNKTAAYLASPQHIDKMTFRLEELFQVRASAIAYTNSDLISGLEKAAGSALFPAVTQVYPIKNSMNELFRQVISKNLSWDTLLTGKNYRAFPVTDGPASFNTSDFLFYHLTGNVARNSKVEADVTFVADDARVAGALTTGRFFARNVNTALNKNRKRAAAIFRMFLCDDMKAVIVDESGNQDEILDKVFPGGNRANGSVHSLAAPGDIHGADPACMKCHYKLDPMGRTFQDSGMILAPLASPGALVYTRANGAKVNIHVNGVGELGRTITQQPEYVSCQVNYFWRWFVGEDKPLTASLKAELASKFEEVGRKPNDFIAYLVNRPEFGYSDSGESNSQLIAQVKNVLQNCNGCHALEKIPSFTDWPIGGSDLNHQRWLGGIRKTMALDGSSAAATMPPKKSSWQPTAQQLKVLQRWFDMGAPNE